MSKTVIEVKDISKKYRIGLKEKKADTFLESVIQIIKSPLNNYRQIRNLSNTKGQDPSIFWALKEISFDVKEGEVLGIIGHNGAGKSTLLKILSRITDPTGGDILIRGRVSSLLEVGTGFHPELTGRENIYMNGTIMGMRKREIDVKFDEIVAFSGVEMHLDTPVKFYSSGMKVRLGFAVAAHLEPEILIIDEVLAVGDSEFQKKCLGKMKDVAGAGRTVLFVSHNMLAVKSLCQTGILLNHGKIVNRGSSEEVVNNYLQAYAPQPEVVFSADDRTANNDLISLKSIAVKSGRKDGTFLISEPIAIEVSLESKRERNYLNVNLFFNSPDGVNIFVTTSKQDYFQQGLIKAVCVVPKDYLNDEFYNIDIMVVENGEKAILSHRNSITIQGVEPPREGSWLGKFPGVIRPKFDWTMEQIN